MTSAQSVVVLAVVIIVAVVAVTNNNNNNIPAFDDLPREQETGGEEGQRCPWRVRDGSGVQGFLGREGVWRSGRSAPRLSLSPWRGSSRCGKEAR